MRKLHPSAGIAIGPILFVLALLGVIATIMSAGGSSSLGSAGAADRIAADIASQANLIRSKINECQLQSLALSETHAVAPCLNDPYPCSNKTDGTAVSALTCPNDPLVSGAQQSLWTGPRPSMLPQPSAGFGSWMYVNDGDDGGRCFWTMPTGGKSTNVVSGLKRVQQKFTGQEMLYDSTSNKQRVVFFITLPDGTGTTNPQCTTAGP